MVVAADTGERRAVGHCPDHSGIVVGLRGIGEDVAELKADVKSLRAQSNRLFGGLGVLVVVAQVIAYFVR